MKCASSCHAELSSSRTRFASHCCAAKTTLYHISFQFGNTALHEVAWTGNVDITKLLLKSHCFVDSVNGTGFTPLHLASQNGHAKIAKTLLKWKANPSVTNQVSRDLYFSLYSAAVTQLVRNMTVSLPHAAWRDSTTPGR